MFEGGGFGVGLTVTELGLVWPAEAGPPGRLPVRPARLSEVLPVAGRSDVEKALELRRVQELKAMIAAYEASLVMGLAADRPEALDPATDEPARADARCPVPGASEFFVDELAVVTNTGSRAAARLAQESYVLVARLPAVWAALADGALDLPRARVFVDVLGHTAAGVAESVSAEVLPRAVGLSPGKLKAVLLRAVVAVDAAAAEQRRADAERCADVRLYPTFDGMAEFAAEMPAPLAAACWSTVDELAQMVKRDGDGRPIGQLRSGVLADLILRPWDTRRPPVTAELTVLAPLPSLLAGNEAEDERGERPAVTPGEVDGLPITAAHVRELLAQLDAVCPGGLQAPTGGSLQIAVTGAGGRLLATASRPELERIARRGCPHDPIGSGVSGGDSGLNEAGGGDCGCPVLAAPLPVDRYAPTPAQRRFVKRRDRTCRHPNCGQPVGRVDLDHVVPYAAGGATDCDNLCCLCRRHHRLKTHAPGWRFVLAADGRLAVTTPSGVTRSTRPPGLAERIEQRALPPPARPAALPEPDDPPPF